MNPSPSGDGLKLNISENENSQDLELALHVADRFRLKRAAAQKVLGEVVGAVRQWKTVAAKLVSAKEISRMKQAFRVADAGR